MNVRMVESHKEKTEGITLSGDFVYKKNIVKYP